MSTSTFRRRGTAVLVTLLVVFGVGIAAAAWVQTGTGFGSAKAQTGVNSTIATERRPPRTSSPARPAATV